MRLDQTLGDEAAGSSFSELMQTHFGLENEYSNVADQILAEAAKIGEIPDWFAARARLQQLFDKQGRCMSPVLRLDVQAQLITPFTARAGSMLELMRPPVPALLATPEMQQYVADCAAYAATCAAAVYPASVPEPAKPGNYRTSDILTAFDTLFFSKCYRTEQWHGSSYEMDVDHFVPVNQNAALKYDWNNLFPAAHKANMMRPRQRVGYLTPARMK